MAPTFDGLTCDDAEAIFAARRQYNVDYLKGCLIGLGITVYEDGEDFNLLESPGASIHLRFRGCISLFKETLPDWHGRVEPFGVPTLKLLEEFSRRISFHATTQELAGGLKALKLTMPQKKGKKKGQKVRAREWSDTRIGASLPKPPQALWRHGNCFYLPFLEKNVPKHIMEGNPANLNMVVERFEPQPWADLLNECWHIRYKGNKTIRQIKKVLFSNVRYGCPKGETGAE